MQATSGSPGPIGVVAAPLVPGRITADGTETIQAGLLRRQSTADGLDGPGEHGS